MVSVDSISSLPTPLLSIEDLKGRSGQYIHVKMILAVAKLFKHTVLDKVEEKTNITNTAAMKVQPSFTFIVN